MENSGSLRQHVIALLKGRGAHVDFEAAVAEFPSHLFGTKPPGTPHSAWQLLEHLRIAQWDILEFTRDPQHVSPKWPEGYWPLTEAPSALELWQNSIDSFLRDSVAMQTLVADPDTDLTAPLPQGQGQTVLREALLVADHNAYHIGQFVMLRILLGVWK